MKENGCIHDSSVPSRWFHIWLAAKKRRRVSLYKPRQGKERGGVLCFQDFFYQVSMSLSRALMPVSTHESWLTWLSDDVHGSNSLLSPPILMGKFLNQNEPQSATPACFPIFCIKDTRSTDSFPAAIRWWFHISINKIIIKWKEGGR